MYKKCFQFESNLSKNLFQQGKNVSMKVLIATPNVLDGEKSFRKTFVKTFCKVQESFYTKFLPDSLSSLLTNGMFTF